MFTKEILKNTKENLSSNHFCSHFLQEGPINLIPSLKCCICTAFSRISEKTVIVDNDEPEVEAILKPEEKIEEQEVKPKVKEGLKSVFKIMDKPIFAPKATPASLASLSHTKGAVFPL